MIARRVNKRRKKRKEVKIKQLIQTYLTYNDNDISIWKQPLNGEANLLTPREIQPEIPWLLEKELLDNRSKTTFP